MSNGLSTPFSQKINGSPLMHLGNAQNIVNAAKQIQLTYLSPTSIGYSAGGFAWDDGSGNISMISAGTINFVGLVAATTYHIFGIYNPTTNISQMHYDTSLASPTLPSGFTKKKHIFSFITNGASQLYPMTIFNLGNSYKVEYVSAKLDHSAILVATTGTLLQFSVPSDISVLANISFNKANVATGTYAVGFTHPSVTSVAGTGSFQDFFGSAFVSGVSQSSGSPALVFTNTNRQLKGSTAPINLTMDVIYTNAYTIYT